MNLAQANRVKETTTTTGTGTLQLGGAVSGFRTFVAGVGENPTEYLLLASNGQYEAGIGTVTNGSPDTLSRDSVSESSTGTAISLPSGTHTVFISQSASIARRAHADIRYCHDAVILGDSICAQNHFASGTQQISQEARGWFTTMQTTLGYPFNVPMSASSSLEIGANFGVGGHELGDIISIQLPKVRAYQATRQKTLTSFFLCGTNDLDAGVVNPASYNQMVANYKLIFNELLQYGPVVVVPILPTSAGGKFTADAEKAHHAINAFLGRFAQNNAGLHLVDIADMYNGTDMRSGYTSDGVHPTVAGGEVLGNAVARALGDKVSGFKELPAGAGNVYDAVYAPDGNHITNTEFSGSSGTSSGTVSGNVPDGWDITVPATITATLSIEINPSIHPFFTGRFLKLNLARSGGSGNGTVSLKFIGMTNFTALDYAQMSCLVKNSLTANSTQMIHRLSTQLTDTVNNRFSAVMASNTSVTQLSLTANERERQHRSDPLFFGTGGSLDFELNIELNLGGVADNVDVWIGRPNVWRLEETPVFPS